MPSLTAVDLLILLLYLVFILGIGLALKSSMKTGKDFLQAGRTMPGWICALAFIAASLGAPEVIGMGAWGARYGLQAFHFYCLGAIPAMLFAGLFMVPLFYGSKARTVPEFLRLRFDEKTRTLNAVLFALMTVFSMGISLYAMARVIQSLQLFDALYRSYGWDSRGIFNFSILIAAVVVLAYVLCGGLAAAIYNQALQFLLLVAGFLPLVVLGLRNIGGWNGLKAALPEAQMHAWKGLGHAGANPMGIEMVGLVLGLGVVLGGSFWCSDFRVMQSAMAAKDLETARRVPVLAAIPKLFLPFLVILPGMLAIALPTPQTKSITRIEGDAIIRTTNVVSPAAAAGNGLVPAKLDPITRRPMVDAKGQSILDYDLATPNLLVHFLPTGLLGLGLTALLACLMSGMAANLTALNAVFTYDLYLPWARKELSDQHLILTGRWTAAGGILLAVGVARAVLGFSSMMDALVLAFSFVTAPLFATFLLGMFWKRATGHGAFSGMIAGIGAALLHHGLTLPSAAQAGLQGGWIAALHRYPSQMEQSFWTAIFSFCVNLLVMVLVSLITEARLESDLVGLVHSLTPRPKQPIWWKRPEALAGAILLVAVALNIWLA